MNQPTSPSTTKYGLRFVAAFSVNGAAQPVETGEAMLNLFFAEIATEKSLEAANLIHVNAASINDAVKMVIVSGKTNGLREELAVTGAEVKTMAEAILKVSAARKTPKIIAEGKKGEKTARQTGAAKAAFLTAIVSSQPVKAGK